MKNLLRVSVALWPILFLCACGAPGHVAVAVPTATPAGLEAHATPEELAQYLFHTDADFCDEATGSLIVHIKDERNGNQITRWTYTPGIPTKTGSGFEVDATGIFATFEDSYDAAGLTSRQLYIPRLAYAPIAASSGAYNWSRPGFGVEAQGTFTYSNSIAWGNPVLQHETYNDPTHPPIYDRQFTHDASGIVRFTVGSGAVTRCK